MTGLIAGGPKVGVVSRLWLALIVSLGLAVADEPAAAQSFDGITVIELNDRDGAAAIGAIGGRYLVTFVSALGSYAALVAQGNRGCIAWMEQGSYTGTSATFGLASEAVPVRNNNPRLCLRFTLRFEGPGEVRMEAANKIPDFGGNISPDNKELRYSRRRPVISQIPLAALDWGAAPFARHDIKGVRLGPVANANAGKNYKLGPLYRSGGVAEKSYSTVVGKQPGRDYDAHVNGRVAATEITGWPWDALVGAWYVEQLPQPANLKSFVQAVNDRYGRPSFSKAQGVASSQASNLHFWVYDLAGRQLGPNDAAPDNCLALEEEWAKNIYQGSASSQLGPWGCSLVMILSHNGGDNFPVSNYRIEAVSGYAKGLNHFLTQLQEVEKIKATLQSAKGNQPQL